MHIRRTAGDRFFWQAARLFLLPQALGLGPLAWVIGRQVIERMLLWLAFSGGAILLERFTAGPPAVEYKENQEK